MKREFYLVAYDIEDNKIRNKISKVLEGYGARVQYSVFECSITQHQYDIMYQRISKLIPKNNMGNVRIYKLCGNCKDRIVNIGTISKELRTYQDDVIII